MVMIYNAARHNYSIDTRRACEERDLLTEVESFLTRHSHLTTGKFGCLSCGDYYIVPKLRRASKIMAKTEQSLREFMRRYVSPGASDSVSQFTDMHCGDAARIGRKGAHEKTPSTVYAGRAKTRLRVE